MSEAAVLEAFPRRPLAVVGAKPKGVRIRNGIIIFLLLCLPAAWLTYKLMREHNLRSDLIERGVRVDTLRTEGECMSRRGIVDDEPRGCWLDATFQVRPEDGGGERTVNTYIRGKAPVLVPDTIYDPRDPNRMMLAPMVEDGLSTSEMVLTPIAALVPIIFLVLWLMTLTNGLEVAAKDPQPLFVPVEDVTQQGRYNFVRMTAPNGASVRDRLDRLAPFTLTYADGSRRALALTGPKDRPFVVDSELKLLDLTEAERRRIFDAADHG